MLKFTRAKKKKKMVKMCLPQRTNARETDTETEKKILCVHRGTKPRRKG